MHMLSRAIENVQPDCWEAIFFSAQVSKLEILIFPSFIYTCVSYLLLLVVLLVQELLFSLMALKF